MRKLVFVLCMMAVCMVGACSRMAPDPFDDVSSVSVADRPALQACLAASDLPANHWPARAGKARCWLSLPQSPSLKEIAALLKAPHGVGKLDRRYAEILSQHYADPVHRDALFRAYQSFRTDDGKQLAAEWLRKSPNSAFAQLARGDAVLGAAWEARGNALVNKTTQAQFAAMDEQLKVAVPLLSEAMRREPRLSPACVDLMQIGNMTGDSAQAISATRHCMNVDPLSYNVNDMWLTGFDPRWGGSFDELDKALEQIRQREPASPTLASLLSKGIGRRAYIYLVNPSSLVSIAADLDKAALVSPDPFYIDKAGKAAEQAGDYAKAKIYFAQALRFAPDEIDFLVDQARWFARNGDRAHALDDLHRAEAQPDDCGCKDYAGIASILLDMDRFEEARVQLRRAMLIPAQRFWALSRMCQTYFMHQFDRTGGMSCTKQFVEEFPDDSGALYLRALALYIIHDPAARQFDARFREHADLSSEVVRNEIAQLNQFARPQP